MKKILLFIMVLLGSIGHTMADDELLVNDITIPQGKTAIAEVYLKTATLTYRDFEFTLQLPQGITIADVRKGDLLADTDHGLSFEGGKVLGASVGGKTFTGTDKPFALVVLQADNTLAVGTTLTIQVTNIELTVDNGGKYNPAGTSFKATIEETVKVLDENSTTVPEASGVARELQVNRTIYANEWSTICLPFAMTAEQITNAFGSNVEFASFVDYETNDGDEIETITVNFESIDYADGIEANYPYLIKTTQNITEFTAEAVVTPDEEAAIVEYDNGKAGNRRVVWGTFFGTLHAGEMIPDNGLFLSNNKFYYSTGSTAIKAFRGYFVFEDVLASKDASEVRFFMNIDGQTTRINGIQSAADNDAIYTLDGRRVSRTPQTKGVFIQNGKKVVK